MDTLSNCITSCSIGALFCFQKCDIEKIRVAFTFLPPPPSYSVVPLNGANGSQSSRGQIIYCSDALKNFNFYQQAAENAEVSFVQTTRGERIPVVWLRPAVSPAPPPVREQPLVLLHCHGNATDIGMMMGPYFEMTKQLGIEVVGVEYSGYGVSTGTPNPSRTYADVEAAYNHIIAQGVPSERIVAYGQSVGSGPASYIASKHQIGGLILHSPLMSGIKVIDPHPDSCCRPSCVFHCFDFYPNDARLKKATCPSFIIHGQHDDIVPFYHGARLADMTPAKFRWPGYFPERAGHNDIVEQNVRGYFRELAGFLQRIASGVGAPTLAQQRPIQVEMTPANVLGARANEADRLTGEGASGGAPLSYAEPTVGPEDGMYAGLRRESPARN